MNRWQCWLGHHKWTSAAQEGIPPTAEQINEPFWGFWDYAKMYCFYCGKEARISQEQRALHPRGKKP